jgi:Tfp pilus assembly protein PilF
VRADYPQITQISQISMQAGKQNTSSGVSQGMNVVNRSARIAIATVCLLAICYAILVASRIGMSSLYSSAVVKGSKLPGSDPEVMMASAERALGLTPSDPEAYRARGVALLSMNQLGEAASEFAHAAALRPRHYLLWVELGQTRDQAGDSEGAIQAFQEAVRFAPYFAQPRWQLGNVLFRAGRYEEAFTELRRAIAGDATLLPLALELAWAVSGDDAAAVEHFIQPADPAARLILARFLAKHGKAVEAVALFRSMGGIADQEQHALVRELLTAKKFRAAYEVWASRRAGLDDSAQGVATITDGGFEQRISRYDPGFGWQVNWEVPTMRIELDAKEPHEGERSLRVEWNGESNPFSQLLTQFVLIEPTTRYRLRFATRVRGVVSGGLPIIVISDAGSADYRLLGQSPPLKEEEREWQECEVEFKSGEKTDAVQISLQRQPCAAGPCPIFGRVWLDAFSLRKI